ncbi:MAG: threonine/serine exporter family protein [Pseudomonadota bacterium]
MSYSEDFIQKRRFIVNLGKALHKYGAPAYRLEAHLREVSDTLGLRSSFMATPTFLTFVLYENEDHQEYNHISRVEPGEIDLGSLARIDLLVDEVISKQQTVLEATERLESIISNVGGYNKLLMFFAFGGASGAFCVLMHTNWATVMWSAFMGLVVCLCTFLAEKSTRLKNVLEPLAALIAAFFLSLLALYDPSIDVPLAILASIIIYIPGLALTIGLSEIAARNLVSGSARVVDGVMSLFKLYFGALLGLALAQLLWPASAFSTTSIVPLWTVWIAVIVLALSLIIIFRIRVNDITWAILSAYIAFGVTYWSGLFLGSTLGAFCGALALGLYSNLFSRLQNLPSSLVMLPGLFLLVPGSKVYIGLNQAVSGKVILATTDVGAQVFLIFMSLVGGLIFADAILPTKKRL